MNEYASLSSVRRNLGLASQNTADDVHLRKFLRDASRSIDKLTKRKFYPYRKTLAFDLPADSRMLKFGRLDLLQVKGLSDLNGASEIDAAVYYLKCGDDHNLSPYDRLVIFSDTGSTFNFSGTPEKAIQVDAVLGYHEDYGTAWINSGASLTQPLNAGTSNTLASVSGSAGEDVYGLTPRFATEQIWRLDGGASNEEYVQVLDTNPENGSDGSIIKILRGINGTSAVDHSTSTTVEVFEVEADIEFSTIELVVWEYQHSANPFTNTIAVPTMGIIEMPGMWPKSITDRLARFEKRKMYATRF